MSMNDGDQHDFKEEFNWWYFFIIVATLLAFPLLHILAWIGRLIFAA